MRLGKAERNIRPREDNGNKEALGMESRRGNTGKPIHSGSPKRLRSDERRELAKIAARAFAAGIAGGCLGWAGTAALESAAPMAAALLAAALAAARAGVVADRKQGAGAGGKARAVGDRLHAGAWGAAIAGVWGISPAGIAAAGVGLAAAALAGIALSPWKASAAGQRAAARRYLRAKSDASEERETLRMAGPRELELFRAIADGDEARALDLMESGADLNAPDANGMRALHHMAPGKRLGVWKSWPPAAGGPSLDRLAREALRRGADPDAADWDLGETPLHAAARRGVKGLARELLRAGASPDLCDQNGETPLGLALENRDGEMARLLLSAGASPELESGASWRRGFPLEIAIQEEVEGIAAELLEAGARIGKPWSLGKSRRKPGEASLRKLAAKGNVAAAEALGWLRAEREASMLERACEGPMGRAGAPEERKARKSL